MTSLSDAKNLWCATTRPDGRPHLTPIWFVFVDDAFWLCTGASSVKVRNLAANPRASISLEDGNEPVVAETTATIHRVPYPQLVVDAFMAKFAWDISPGYDTDLDQTALVQLRVDRWLMGEPSPET